MPPSDDLPFESELSLLFPQVNQVIDIDVKLYQSSVISCEPKPNPDGTSWAQNRKPTPLGGLDRVVVPHRCTRSTGHGKKHLIGGSVPRSGRRHRPDNGDHRSVKQADPVVGRTAIKRVALDALSSQLAVVRAHELPFLFSTLLDGEAGPDEVPEITARKSGRQGLPIDNHNVPSR